MHAFDAEKLLEAVRRSAPSAAGCPDRSTSYGEGTLLTPSIRLVRPIGDGGMASVWVAKHENLGINVAVKLLAEGMLDHPVIHKRFLEEGPAAARIKSPHVVQIFDRGVTARGVPFIVMELLEGETVQQRIDRTGIFSLAEAFRVVAQTARALAKTHAAGVVHCDVKPDNLFLVDGEPELFVKILDFGIAKRLGEHDLSGMIFGTPGYMAPEQMEHGGELGVHTDVWSLAVACYQMLTATVPFRGDTLEAVAAAIEQEYFVPVTQLRMDLPAALDHWFSCALAKDRKARFATVQDMIASLDRIVHPGPLAARSSIRLLTESDLPLPADPVSHSVAAPTYRPYRWVLPALAAVMIVGAGAAFTVARPLRDDHHDTALESGNVEPPAAAAAVTSESLDVPPFVGAAPAFVEASPSPPPRPSVVSATAEPSAAPSAKPAVRRFKSATPPRDLFKPRALVPEPEKVEIPPEPAAPQEPSAEPTPDPRIELTPPPAPTPEPGAGGGSPMTL